MDSKIALKGHVAEALVEGIFRRARYHVALIGRDHPVHSGEIGGDEFIPDLLVWRHVADDSGDLPIARLTAVEIKYRADIDRSVPCDVEALARYARHWPEFYLVYVTDRPAPGRSCFQAVDVRQWRSGSRWTATNLYDTAGLDISWSNVQEHERLVPALFPVLSRAPRRARPKRAALASSPRGLSVATAS